MFGMGMLCDVEIYQCRPSCGDGIRKMIDAEALEVAHPELSFQPVAGCGLTVGPIFKFEDELFAVEEFLVASFLSALHQHFLGCKSRNEFVDIFHSSLCGKEFSRRDVEEGNAHSRLSEVYGSEEIALTTVEHIVTECHTGSDEFGDAALHQFLRQFRVLKLVADGYTESRAHQPWQVVFEGMIRESCHFNVL